MLVEKIMEDFGLWLERKGYKRRTVRTYKSSAYSFLLYIKEEYSEGLLYEEYKRKYVHDEPSKYSWHCNRIIEFLTKLNIDPSIINASFNMHPMEGLEDKYDARISTWKKSIGN